MTVHVSKDSSLTLTKQKSWSSSAGLLLQLKYLVITLTRDGSMLTAAEKMAGNLRSAIARAYRTGDSKV
jgi:hypothetical protein